MFEFLHELTEARLYKGHDTLAGEDAHTIAKAIYLIIMMLEVMRLELDKPYARQYAYSTIKYNNFDDMHQNTTDLQNMLSILANQHKHDSKIKIDTDIYVPTLQLRRYFRDVSEGNKNETLDIQLFMRLESIFKINDGQYKQLRRHITDWDDCSESEKTSVIKELKRLIITLHNLRPEISEHFKTLQ